jgi:hypothetical protein
VLAALLAALLQLWRDLPLAGRLARHIELSGPRRRHALPALADSLCMELLALGPGKPHVAQQMLAVLQQPLLWSACHGVGAGGEDALGSGEEAAQQRARVRSLLLTVAPKVLLELLLLSPARSEPPGTTGWGYASQGGSYHAACGLLQLLDCGLGGRLEQGELSGLGLAQLAAALPLPGPGNPGGPQLAELHGQLAALLARQLGRGQGLGDEAAQTLVAVLLQNLQVGGRLSGRLRGWSAQLRLGRARCGCRVGYATQLSNLHRR